MASIGKVPGPVELQKESASTTAGHVECAGTVIEVDRVREQATNVNATVRTNGDSVAQVYGGTTVLLCENKIAIRVEFHDEDVVATGARQIVGPRSRIDPLVNV